MKYAEDIRLIQAYGGWSPIDWVNHQLLPDNFSADFPSGIAAYRMSSFMQLYLMVAQLGFELEALMPLVIYMEILVLGVSAAVLFRALAPQAPYAAMLIFALLVVEGSARGMDLARFGTGFYQGIFYNIADGLRFLGLALLFRRKLLLAAILLGIGFTVHPVMAGMACVFATPYVLLIWKRFSLRHWLLAAGSFLLIAGSWFVFNIQSAEIASGGIPAHAWINLVRTFTFHWFPVDIGVFSTMHAEYALPLLCLVLLSLLYLPRVVQGRAEQMGIILGIALLMILTIGGVLISEYSSDPFMIKLSLHRASQTIIVVSLLIVVAGLVREVSDGNVFTGAFAVALLASPVLDLNPVFPAITTIGLIGLLCFRAYFHNERRTALVSLVCLLILGLTLAFYYSIGIPDLAAYLGSILLWKILFSALAILALLWCLTKAGIKHTILKRLPETILLAVVLFLCVASTEKKTTMKVAKKEFATDYLAVQRWAHANTKNDALFMVDPTIHYGWRDFSQRSSFGNLREWLHTGWLYDSQAEVYEEGLRRFNEFGFDIDSYLSDHPSINGYVRLLNDIKQRFYSQDSGWFVNLSGRYGIDYLVMQKDQVDQNYGFSTSFENSSFVVYRLNDSGEKLPYGFK
tara:strand:- start:266 stop:2158 length:1893 start_codon:yes stop_codon:yes gene_type:complete